LFFAQGWPQALILYPLASCIAGMTDTYHQTWLVWLRLGRGSLAFH
jgi:hypothetical protein